MASNEADPSKSPQDDPPPPASSAAMISNLLSKLKPPNILRDPAWIPRFRDTCFPLPAAPPPPQQQAPNDEGSKDAAAPSENDPSPTSWQHHLAPAPPEAYTSAFSSLLSGRSTTPSLIWFGEQHHQPHVIRAQIQLLAALADHLDEQAAKSNAPPPTSSSTQRRPPRRVRYHLHLLLEHFSLLDQPLLDRLHSGLLDIGELCAAYRQRSDEKFQVEMYAPLLLLARERGATVWGGFPPRSWARRVVKEGVEGVRGLEGERVGRVEAGQDGEEGKQQLQPSSTSEAQPLIPLPTLPTTSRRSLPLFTSWSHVTHLSRSHRSFLDSLMKPHLPPYFPRLPAGSSLEPGLASRYPTEQLDLSPPPAVSKGFAPAQALKDAFLAHAAISLLREGHLLAGHDAAQDRGENVEHRNIVMVVAGLGHVQAGFGAPERVVMPRCERAGGAVEGLKEEDGRKTESLIVLSMPRDSSLWLGPEWKVPVTRQEGEATVAAATAPGTTHEDDGAATSATTAAAAVPSQKPVIPEGWGRKLADAIVLYDWIDLEKEKEPPPPPSTKAETPQAPTSGGAEATAPAAQAATAARGAEQKQREAAREGKGEKKSS